MATGIENNGPVIDRRARRMRTAVREALAPRSGSSVARAHVHHVSQRPALLKSIEVVEEYLIVTFIDLRRSAG